MKFETFAQQWLAHNISIESWRPITARNYQSLIVAHLAPALAGVELESVTRMTAQKLLHDLKSKMCPARANKAVCLLRTILDAAVGEGLIDRNLIGKIELLEETAPVIQPWTMKEMKRVLDHIPARWQPYFTTLIYTGARPGELAALKWTDISLSEAKMVIKRSRSAGHDNDTPKTENAIRTIPLHDAVVDVLRQMTPSSTYVFTNKKGEPIDRSMTEIWERACEAAGVEYRRSYMIRHSCISRLVNKIGIVKNLDISTISRVAGHSNPNTTIKMYMRTLIEDQEQSDKAVRSAL